MFKKESLYINIIKYKTQLKINYKKLKNSNIIETNSSTAIVKDDILGRDVYGKLDTYASKIDNTYLSTFLFQDETKLIKRTQNELKDSAVIPFNNEYNIAVPKNVLFETKNYFDKCGIDYIFSSYHILNLHIKQNPCNNNLVILLFNNQAFCIIVNNNGDIVFNRRLNFTAFEEIKESNFYENEILGQKLFDEIYFLEFYSLVQSIIEEFHSVKKDVFIKKVSILYDLKLLSEEQIKQMNDDFMVYTTYHPISVDEELFELSRDSYANTSFIRPRKKPNNSLKTIFMSLFLIAIILGTGYLFLPLNELLKNKKEEFIKNIQQIEVELPNHIRKNKLIEEKVLKSLNTIPYDVVLQELILEKNLLKMDIELLNKDTFIKVLQPELLKLYKTTKIEFKKNKIPILEATVQADSFNDKVNIGLKKYKDVYIEDEFMPIIRVTEQIKILLPKNSVVRFKSSSKSNFITFNYIINAVVQNPSEFFDIINKLNKELYSINISYPIIFTKTKRGIEIEFILQFHQPN